MERKLVRQGRNALTVTLPAPWLKNRCLSAGDSVFVSERNQELVIGARLTAPRLEGTADVRDCERSMIYHILLAKYIEGYDTIVVLHNNAKLIQEVAKSLLGMIIEEHTPARTTLKSVIAVPEENFLAVLRRAAHILVQQAKTMQALTVHKARVDDVKAQEELLDYNLRYCLRYLNKYENREHAYKYFLLCTTLELAGDEVSAIAKEIRKDAQLAQIIAKGIEEYTECLFKNDLKKLYIGLRAFRSSIGKKTFAQGIAHTLAETLYNDIGYVVQQEK